jgi:hypothetical protein
MFFQASKHLPEGTEEKHKNFSQDSRPESHISYFASVAAVGFAFHNCLLLVLLLWKPSGDDPALFYVISAAWGVCNAIWETLNFSEFSVTHQCN